MKDEDDDEETQALIRKQEKTLLKVLKYKLKDRWQFSKIISVVSIEIRALWII